MRKKKVLHRRILEKDLFSWCSMESRKARGLNSRSLRLSFGAIHILILVHIYIRQNWGLFEGVYHSFKENEVLHVGGLPVFNVT